MSERERERESVRACVRARVCVRACVRCVHACMHACECLSARPTACLYNKSFLFQPKCRAIFESEGFFRNLPQIEGAIDAVKQMSGMKGCVCELFPICITDSNHYPSF